MADIIQLRRDTASNWTSSNPTLAQGEMGIETDTIKLKIGDGTTAWTSLGYYTTTVGSGWGNVHIVAISGGDFTSVSSAITAANSAASISTPQVIIVHAGNYIEGAMTLSSYVTVVLKPSATVIASASASPLFTLANNTVVSGGAITGPASHAAIYNPAGITQAAIENIRFYSGQEAVRSTGASASLLVEECKMYSSVGVAILADNGGRIDCFNILSYATTSIMADDGTVWVHNSGASGGTNGLYADDGGQIFVHSFTNDNVTNGVRVGTTVGIGSSIEGTAVSCRGIHTWDILQEASGEIRLTGCLFESEHLSIVDWNVMDVDYNSNDDGDEGFNIIGELHVGQPEMGSESCIGEGDSVFRGQLCYVYDNGTSSYTDKSTEASSASDSTFTMGTDINDAIYWSTNIQTPSDYYQFLGLKADINTALVIGSGETIFEYWNGSSWTELVYMITQSSGKYLPLAKTVFEQTGSTQIRFNINILDDWAKNDPISSGINRFWVRMRIVTTITTAPVIEQTKQHTNRTEINSDGWIEYFGKARPLVRLPWDWGMTSAMAQSPADQDLYLGDSLGVGRIENKFANGATDQQGLNAYIPLDIDTSSPVKLRFSYVTDDASAGNIRIVVRWGWSQDGDSVYRTTTDAPTAGTNEQSVTEIFAAPTSANIQASHVVSLDISDMISRSSSSDPDGDIMWVTIERNGGDGDDTHNGDISIINMAPYYYCWCEGGHN